MQKNFLPLLLGLLLLSACSLKEPIAPEYEAYIGQWESETYVLEILANGGAVLDSNRPFDTPRIEGYVRFNDVKDKIIIVGLDEDGGRKALRIDRAPAISYLPTGEEVMTMTLNGVELLRQ